VATLERDGWIHAGGTRRLPGPGKPAVLYVLAPAAAAVLSTAYRPLLLGLLASLAARDRPAQRRALLRRVGRRLALQLGDGGTGQPRERAARLLERLGGVVETTATRKGRFEVRGLGCPVAEAVAVEPRACQAVSALLAGALGARVVERCDRSGEPSCRFVVTLAP
jgi:predicted ArsR family transcriptional regulator